ncbi:MAG: homoserine dehydrogenase [Lentisphaeria bacterium]|nr:homoserine dehydrogenase [Lentisphaeria bacterium]
MREFNIGIVGFGTVGAGVVECILKNGDLIGSRAGVWPVIRRVADLDITTDRGVTLPEGVLTTDVARVVDAPDIDVVIELIGGTALAKDFILRALNNGKPVITANKALLAKHGAEIFAAAKASKADVFYEASVAGGIPIIKAVREGLAGNRILEICGILNGTCNYILTQMEKHGADFATVLGQAQAAGYAETPPDLDIDGLDTAHKATILASLAYGEWFGMEPLFVEGIRGIALQDIDNADALGYRIKLLAIIKQDTGKVEMRVHPALVPKRAMLANVDGVFNAVCVRGDTVGDTMYYGRGAGREATASAVVADIIDVALNAKSGSPRRIPAFHPHEGYTSIVKMDDVQTRYYLRLQVEDHAGVLSAIADILGGLNISIASLSQKETGGTFVPLVILTHLAREADMRAAMDKFAASDIVAGAPVLLRVEDLD